MKQDINTNSRRGRHGKKGGKKKSLDIDFASVPLDAAGRSIVESESDDIDANKEAIVDDTGNSTVLHNNSQKVEYYDSQSKKPDVNVAQQKKSKNKKDTAKSAAKVEQKTHTDFDRKDKTGKITIENPGDILRAAREARNISQEDIAKWMKLDVHLIDALERDDDSVLPETVYKVGYLRSYAKLVELSPDTVIGKQASYSKTPRFESQIEDKNLINEFLNQLSQLFPSQWASSIKDNDIKRGTFLAISVISFIAIAWTTASLLRSNQDSTSTQDIQKTINQESAELNTETLRTTSLEINVPKGDVGFKNEISESLASNRPVSTLVLNFSADSWVDIRDATGERLIRRLGLAGMSKGVSGVAPFQVLIGYGPGVTITYNGKPYDFANYQGKRVARFIIAPESTPN